MGIPHLHGDLSLATQGPYCKTDPTADAAMQRTRKGGHCSSAQARQPSQAPLTSMHTHLTAVEMPFMSYNLCMEGDFHTCRNRHNWHRCL
jgi:hypothetical protein